MRPSPHARVPGGRLLGAREGGVARPRRETLQVANQVMALHAAETNPVCDLGHADGRGLGPLPDVHTDEDGRRHPTITGADAPPRTGASMVADQSGRRGPGR